MAQTQVSGSGIKDNVITNSHLHSAANIAGSKLANSGVTAGSYGSGSATLSLTINAQGLITAASTNSISTDLVNDTSPQLGGNLDTNSRDILFSDNASAKFGAGTDLEIYHDPNNNHSYITESGSGRLIVKTDYFEVDNAAGNEAMIEAIQDGAVNLYNNGSKRFETSGDGAIVTGPTSTTCALKVVGGEGHSAEVQLKADEGDDNTDTCRLHQSINGNFYLQNLADGSFETMLMAVPNGAVELYHNNTKRLETSAAGVTVSGTTHTTGSFTLLDNGKLMAGAGSDLQIYHNGTNSYVRNSTGQLLVGGSGGNLVLEALGDVRTLTWEGESMIEAKRNGAVELYHDNVKKLETGADRVNISGHLFVNSGNRVYIQNGFNDSVGSINNTGGSNDSNLNFYVRNAGTEATALKIQKTGNVEIPVDKGLYIGASQDMQLYHNGTDSYILNATGNLRIGQYNNASLKFFTNNSTRWNIDGSGHFLPDANNSFDIGTSSYRVRNIYTNDLHLSNEGSSNDVDGTWGSFTIQEGAEDLFLVNKRNGKKYKFALTEVS